MTNSNTSHTQKILLTTLTILFLTGLSAADVTGVTGNSAADVEIGNEGTSVTQTVNFDVTIDGSSSSETVTIDVSNAEDAGSDVSIPGGTGDVTLTGGDTGEVSVNGVTDNTGSSTEEIDVTLTDDNSGDTSHTVTVEVTLTHDTSGVNSETTSTSYTIKDAADGSPSGSVSFPFKDTVNPTTAFTSLNTATHQSGEDVTINYDLQDVGTGINSGAVQIQDDSGNVEVEETVSGSLSTGTSQSVTLTLPSNLADGTYDVVVTGTDNAGNSNTATGTDALTIDDKVSSITVADDPAQPSETITVTGQASSSADDVTFQIDGSSNTGTVTKSITDQSFSVELDLVNDLSVTPEDGSVTVNAQQEPNYNTQEATDSFTVDSQAPTTSVTVPSSDVQPTETISVNYDLTDDVSIQSATMTLTDSDSDGDQIQKTLTDSSTGNGNSVSFDLTQLADSQAAEGSYTVTFDAIDAAGNTASPVSDSGNVDGNPPSIQNAEVTGSNEVTLTFDEGVYSSDTESGTLGTGDFSYNDANSEGASGINGVTHSTAGDSTVIITLTSEVDNSDLSTDEIQINDGSVYDQAGNAVSGSTATTYTDGSTDDVNPSVQSFTAVEDGSSIKVTVQADESLSTIDVSDGSSNSLTFSDFSETQNDNEYTASYSPGDGSYTVSLDQVGDGINTVNPSDTSSATVDTTAPTLDSSDDGTTKTSSTPTFAFTVSDTTSSVDTSTLDLKIADSDTSDGAEFDKTGYGPSGSSNGVTYSDGTFTVDVSNLEGSPTLEDGSVTVTLGVDDTDGNSLSGETFSFKVDTTPPEISSPTVVVTNDQNDNGILNPGDKFKVSAEVTDAVSSVNSVTANLQSLTVEESKELAAGDGDSYSKTFTVADDGSKDGELTFQVSATDTQSNPDSKDVNGSVSVDNNLPSVSADSATRKADGEIDVAFSSSTDSAEVDSFNVYRKTSSGEYSSVGTKSSAGTFTDTETTHNTQYTYKVEVIDDAGNKVNSTSTVSATADSEAPTVTYTGNDYETTDSPASVTFDLTETVDSVSQSSIEVTLNDSEGKKLDAATVSSSDYLTYSSNTLTIDLTGGTEIDLAEGDVNVSVKAADSTGNSDTTLFEDAFTVDTKQPKVQKVETLDTEPNRNIDTYRVTYSEEVQGVDTNDIESPTISGVSQEGAVVNYTLDSETTGTAATPDVSFATGKVQDLAGNNLATSSKQAVDSANPVIDLSEGMNLVSFPISDNSDLSVSEVLDESKTNKVWKYDAVSDSWEAWTPEKASNEGFSFSVEAGQGYIVDADESYKATPEIDELGATESTPTGQFELGDGWNLVGHFKEAPQTVTSGESITSDGALGQIQTSAIKEVRTDADTNIGSDAKFNSGEAYWVRMKSIPGGYPIEYLAN